ncbi:MAG: aminotransferase class III-fold pyridoxal phosphate-dependent enzyme [Chloroflexi bacterium]|nr:aminotransferase class III-fold pyridoxal phosphate-dependent enzyme [Chloroflexota bacterium]
MQASDWDLLERLSPGVHQRPRDADYWLRRSAEVLAESTQSRDLYPVLDHSRGEGLCIYDLAGNAYLDMTSGVAVRALGLRYPRLVQFEREIAHVVEELPGQDFDHIPQTLLAERLLATVPGTTPRQVFFTTSGARAVETAVKAAIDRTHRTRFVAFRPAFHGRTGYALSLTASKAVHRNYYPQALPVVRTPYAYCYRCPLGLQPNNCGVACAELVREALQREGTDIAGIVVEPISGEGGMIVPHPEFLPRLREIANEYDAWLIVDEVQSGLGRTGKWWAVEHFGVEPDVICTAKALGGGAPMGATIAPTPMFRGASRHSETFSAEPRMALISLFILRELEVGGYLERAAQVGRVLLDGLKHLEEKYDIVGEARGLGLMLGLEIVEDKKSRRASPAIRDEVVRVCVHRERLLVLGAGDNAVRLLPPLTVTEEEARDALARLDRALETVAVSG